ncbi:MAG TPA: hypothetical protein VJ112_04570 [Rhabdochlamydiaceae bacterium]|nr:hypothetical protein [Rhabdochlamydiaceae bacterium]
MMARKYFIVIFTLLLIFVADRRLHNRDIHFSPDNVITGNPYPSLEMGELAPTEVKAILSQKFTYYSKGSQSYVFISEDQKYILKLFKRYVYEPRSFLAYIPLSFNPFFREHQAKLQKKSATFQACATAYREIKERCGMVYLHLNPTKHQLPKGDLVDKRGKKYELDFDQTCFQLQKKAQLIYPRIAELMQAGEVAQAKEIISSIFDTLDEFGKKGICENDPILRKNFGLIDDRAVQIDVGKMKINEERKKNQAYKLEIEGISLRFKQWLAENYPQLLPHFHKKLKEITVYQECNAALHQ